MSTLQQIRSGVNHMWDSLIDGWQALYRHAQGAVTHFNPSPESTTDQPLVNATHRNVGWGVLAAEVSDDDDSVIVRLEAPGLSAQDFELQVTDDVLVVSGEKRINRERTQGNFHVSECAYGRFERAIALPDEVAADDTTAKYENGVLEIVLPKSPARRRRVIPVSVH